LRIAQIAPLWFPIPPTKYYGGIETLIHLLTEELVARGHDVTLFASGDSRTNAKLHSVCDNCLLSLINDKRAYTHDYYIQANIADVINLADKFDIIHCHSGLQWIPMTNSIKTPVIHSTHSGLTIDDIWMLERYPDIPVIFVSNDQRSLISTKGRRNTYTVYNACDFSALKFSIQSGQYLAFLGRMSPNKNPLGAIKIANLVGMPIVLGGAPMTNEEHKYFEKQIAPLIDNVHVIYRGAVNHLEKNELLMNAAAFVFPIQGKETFGIVMIESMACGTPVVARRIGSVEEVVDFGQTGYFADSLEQMVPMVEKALQLDRQKVREVAAKRFSVQQMVDQYESLYQEIANHKSGANT